ncbi:plasmid stabilization system [Desulfonatronospira thiodismutans ASO3-1]|uniref:Plasmid stabilization system n=1 Tax=Desulfonatronospira thiodismutans ASO3-1 TaxID=555779 RepID=D6STX6_9BACT|nr:plasmid stabilization system [Desulfonatronospira thiodismutans ASO3-1]
MRVEYHPAIEQEIQEIVDYYNKVVDGLGTEFLKEFDKQVAKIVDMPYRWNAVEKGIRRSLMRRFPYVIYFRVVSKDLLRITVVKHQRRHPRLGVGRK